MTVAVPLGVREDEHRSGGGYRYDDEELSEAELLQPPVTSV